MKTAGVAELKAKLSEHLALVKRGEEVLITERGKPVARLVPELAAETDERARLQRLAARGILRLGKRRDRRRPLPPPVQGIPEGAIVEAVREDREEGG